MLSCKFYRFNFIYKIFFICISFNEFCFRVKNILSLYFFVINLDDLEKNILIFKINLII